MSRKGRLVYSTDPRARRDRHSSTPAASPGAQTIYVSRERKGRRGKTVTIIAGLAASARDKKALLKSLKAQCGAGGAVKDEHLELQGDHRQRVMEHLTGLGFRVKAKGG